MIKCIVIYFFLTQLCVHMEAQEQVKKFVQQTAVSISTVEPDSTNFLDFAPIGAAIGDARIVMLGEQDHGDAPVYLAKARLIKYLHEEKGFNVLAFESDFFGLNDGWDHLNKTQPIDSFLIKNIYSIWTFCHTCENLFFHYLPGTLSTNKPIMLAGIDNQMMTNHSGGHLIPTLDSVLQQLKVPVTKDADYSTLILSTIDTLHYLGVFKSPAFFNRCTDYLALIKQQVAEKGLAENSFWMMLINNLIAEKDEQQLSKTSDDAAQTVRDRQMAKNLQWLAATKYPHEKIIVWAANAHIAKFPNKASESALTFTRMGQSFTSENWLAAKTYILGFSSYEGEAGRLGFSTYQIRKPAPNGFENWINPSWKYAFVDFAQLNDKSKPFYLKAFAHTGFYKYDWANVFDGIFYIRTMYPCKSR